MQIDPRPPTVLEMIDLIDVVAEQAESLRMFDEAARLRHLARKMLLGEV